MSIDSIFLQQFNSTNRLINSMIANIQNDIKTSNIDSLIGCCKAISESEHIFKQNTDLLNTIKENMEIIKPRISKLEVQFYCFDTEQVFKLLVAYSKAIINGDSEERINAIYKNLMYMYDKYTMYESKFM